MTLSALIRKRGTGSLATATSAISATQPKVDVSKVATIATVAVANPKEGKTAPLPQVGVGETATTSRWWLIHYPDRDPVKVACCSEATHADILERNMDATAAEPFIPTIRQPSAPLTSSEEAAIRAWLALIEEADPETIVEVIGHCQRDADARDYFTGRAAEELPKLDPFPDDRRTCEQCANLIALRCQAARRGEIVASRDFMPIHDLPRRCLGFLPRADDPDRRSGRERWAGQSQKAGK